MRTGAFSRPRSKLYIILMPLLVAACALGAAMILAQSLVSRERQQLLGRTDAEAKHVAAQLRFAVLQSMDVLPRIANWWLSQGRPEAREDWETDAQLFLRSGTGLRELVWIDAKLRHCGRCVPVGYPTLNITRRMRNWQLPCCRHARVALSRFPTLPIGTACLVFLPVLRSARDGSSAL